MVLGYRAEGDWGWPRTMRYSATSTNAVDNGSIFASSTGVGRWISGDISERRQNAKWWGMVGDGATDNSDAFARLLAHSRDIEIPRGRYAFARPIQITNAESVSIVSPDGSFQGGYHSTNLVTKAEFLYTGPSTNIFFDFQPAPTPTLRYGNRVENVSFNANGLADTCVRIGYLGRGRFIGCRFNGATGVNWLLNASQFVTFIDCSTSINDETPTPTVHATYGMSLTNFSPCNVFINCQWENSSGTAVLLAGNAKNNTFVGGAIEANDGDGLVLESGATGNTFSGTWFEANGGTNSLWVKSGAIQNTFTGLRMYEDTGAVRVSGSYNSFRNFGANTIWIEASGTRNKWENMLWITELIDDTAGGQMFVDMINADATIRTNTLSAPFVQYGEPFALWNYTNLHARTELKYGQLGFGDGSNAIDWRLQRFGANVGGTTNEFRVVAPYASYDAVSLYNAEPYIVYTNQIIDLGGGLFQTNSLPASTNNYSKTHATWSPEAIAFGPGTATRDTSWKRRGVSSWLTESEIWSERPTSNDVVVAGFTPGDTALRWVVRADGHASVGSGSGPRDTAFSRSALGVWRMENVIELPIITAPPVQPASGWGRLYLTTNSFGKGVVQIIWPSGATNTLTTEP